MARVPLPDLRIVPIESVILQEHRDETIARGLIRRLERDGILINPPIVASLGKRRFLHLDGANRITSLDALGYPHLLVQVVDYYDSQMVQLKSWSHVSEVDWRLFLRLLKKIPGLTIKRCKVVGKRCFDFQPRTICIVVFSEGLAFRVQGNRDLIKKVKELNQVFNLYRHLVERDQEDVIFNEETLKGFFARHRGKNVGLFFPTFTPQEVVKVVEAGAKFPAGVTRHIISFRAFRVNFPLKVLKSRKSLTKKREFLKKFLEKIEWRVYEEPVVMGER